VAVAGSFGDPNGPFAVTTALVVQFESDGTTFEVGNYEFVAATFSGTLNSSASNITVANANKTSSDYASSITPSDFTPAVDLTGDLIGTLYYGDSGSDDRLTNGANNLVLTPAGSVTLPKGGTISEGVVTSNPTIQLMPARPDVASQKLVIKGGGIGLYVQNNGLELDWNFDSFAIGNTIYFTVYSDTFVNQTLYWWIYPKDAGIGDVNYGTVIVPSDSSGGTFSILIDSDDYEFTVRVSPENNNYDPDNVGVESYLFNGEAPTYPDHHLHLTTGNLAETSIFLGTDNHNVRTTIDGGIQVTTESTTVELPHTITISGADVAAVNLVYTRDIGTTPVWTSPVNNPSEDPYIQFLDGQLGIVAPAYGLTPIYVNTGTIAVPLALWSLNPPLGSVAPTGIYTYIAPDVHAWTFGPDGTVTFPTLTVPISDNTTPNGTGQTLKFSDSSQQAIIFGPVSTGSSPSAERIIIQGAPGYTGTTGEGGDIYLWAGPGGSTNGDGGDIKVRAGYGPGTGQGGYLNFQAGDSATGYGGHINIESGETGTYGQGSDITVQARSGGEIYLRTYKSNGTPNNWLLSNNGVLTLPKASKVSEVTPATGAAATVIVIQVASSIANVSFVSVPPAPILNYTVPGTDIVVDVNWNANGSEYHSPRFTVVDGGTGHTGGGESGGGDVLTVPYVDMGITTVGNWTWYVADIASDLVLEAGLKDWTFAADGVITLPNSMTIGSYGTLGENAFLEIGGDDTRIGIDNDGAPPGLTITTNATGGMAQRQWRFGPDGDLTFPDATVQTTAFTGPPTPPALASLLSTATTIAITAATAENGPSTAITVEITNHQPNHYNTTAYTENIISTGLVVIPDTTQSPPIDHSMMKPGTVLLTQTYNLGVSGSQANSHYIAYAYVVTPFGTVWSAPTSGTLGSVCLIEGTMISLADGTRKAIEDITYTDKLQSWDFDQGCYAETTALWIKQAETGYQYNLLTFSDGTTLRTFDQHRIFNKEAGAFTYPMTDATPIGTTTINENGQEITLVDKQVVHDTINYYNVITDYHMNLFSDSILTSCRFNNIYPITDMKFVKDTRTLRTRDEFENIPDRFFYGLRLAEQTTDIETVEWYVNRLISFEIESQLVTE
jgi:hypothetical protein